MINKRLEEVKEDLAERMTKKKDLEEKLKIAADELDVMKLEEKIVKMNLERFEGLRSYEKKEQERERELVRERQVEIEGLLAEREEDQRKFEKEKERKAEKEKEERNRARKERAEKLDEEWYKEYDWMDRYCLCAGGVANLCEGCDWLYNGRWGRWPWEHEVVWWEEGIEKRGWYKEGKGVRKY